MSLQIDKQYLELIQQLPDNIEEYQYWKGLQERKIYFNDEVDMTIINKITHNIIRWNEEDDKDNIPVNERKKITIYISSNGGCVVSGLSVLDAIKASKTKIVTIGVGVCASMGALLLIGGHERKCYRNTTILLHDGSLSLSSSAKKARDTMQYYESLEERIKKFIIERTNIPEELYNEKSDSEWYMFGDQALNYSIVDSLIE